MIIGLDQNSLGHLPAAKGIQVLDFARRLGVRGVQFLDIHEVSPRLDRGELREAHAHAGQHGMYLEVGVICISPHQPNKALLALGDGSLEAGLARHLGLIAEVSRGSRTVRCYVGGPGDRVRGPAPWKQQVRDSVAVAKAVAPVLRDLNLKLAFENHADLSTHEAIEIVSEVGPDVAGLCLDMGNTMVALEEPLAAARRAAPYTVATHLKDGVLVFGDDGLVLSPRPAGQGLLPIAEILQVLHAANPALSISIEDYGMLLPIEIFDPSYVSSFDPVSAVELAQLVRMARLCEQSIAERRLESPAAVERVPWSVRGNRRLEESAAFVNGVVQMLGLQS